MVIKMKIAILTPYSLKEWGGVENWIFQIAELLSKKHEVTVVSNGLIFKKRIEFLPEHSFKYYEIKTPAINTKPSIIFLKVPDSIKNYDIIYLYHTSLFYSYQVLSIFKQPVILGVHSELLLPITFDFLKKCYIFCFHLLSKKATKIACRSRNQIEYLHNQFDIKQDKLFLNRPFIDLNKYKPTNSKKHFSIIFVGRFVEGKGITTLIKSINYLPNDVNIIFVGSGDKSFELIIDKLSKSHSNVIWTGVLTGKKLYDLFANSSVLVNPSRSEAFPNVVLQSLASGTPVILSKIPAHEELAALLPEGTYSLFSYGNALELAHEIKKWKKLIDINANQYKEICVKSHSFIKYNFSANYVIQSFESMIKEVLMNEK